MCKRLVSESGGRPGRSSDEVSVMGMERRAWLVHFQISLQFA